MATLLFIIPNKKQMDWNKCQKAAMEHHTANGGWICHSRWSPFKWPCWHFIPSHRLLGTCPLFSHSPYCMPHWRHNNRVHIEQQHHHASFTATYPNCTDHALAPVASHGPRCHRSQILLLDPHGTPFILRLKTWFEQDCPSRFQELLLSLF